MEENQVETHEPNGSRRTSGWLIALLVLLFAATAISFGYGYRQHQAVNDISNQNETLSASVTQTGAQMDSLAAKLEALATQPPAAPASANGASAARPARSRAEERRLKQMQTQLAEQQKQLKETQDAVETAKSELGGRLDSTRDELNGSIARTHEDVVALQKRGERNYFEFDLSKSKNFQRAGSLLLSLRRADMKHKNYDLMLVVDDNTLSKKRVNLYEPVWIHRVDDTQPVQIVINRINKNSVQGYVSEPKYRQSELGATSTPGEGPHTPIWQ